MSASPNLRLPYLDANQNQKTVTHNAALRMLDALVNLHVASAALQAPPATLNDGQCWIVASGGSGAWLGKDLNIAAWQDGAWAFYAPNPGFVAYVDALQGAVMWNGSAWVSLLGAISQLSLTGLGIGTAVDAGNPLSAKLNAALFAAVPTNASPAGTGDLRVKLSKQASGNTTSLLFQDNYSGRAEIGLLGDDNFHIKVSPDGTAFIDAIVVAGTNGAASFAAIPTHPSPAVQDNSTASATTAWVAAQGYATAAAATSAAPVQSVAGRTGTVSLAVADVSGAAPLASPALTGNPTAPNAAAGTNSAQIATTSFVAASFVTSAYASANYATLVSPTLTGTPTAPTAPAKDNSTKLATTAYVDRGDAAAIARTQVVDTAYTVLASDRTVAVTSLTAARVLTLPAASAYPQGAVLTVLDESGACSPINTITLNRAGSSDAINGAASAVLSVAYGYMAIESNGTNKWTIVDQTAPVQSIAGRTGAVILAVADVSGAAPLASPVLSGTPTAPNAAAGTNSAQIATTSFVAASFVTYAYAGATYATASNATLTGTPTAPTQAVKDNSTRIATTAYADRAVAASQARTQVSDAAYTIVPTDRTVAIIALTAARMLTLPAASAYPQGAVLTVVDESGACSGTNVLTVTASGSDTVNGAPSAAITTAYGYIALQSNTANKWTVVDTPAPPLAFDAGAALLDPVSLAPVLPSFDYRLLAPDCVPPGQFSRLSTGYRTLSSGLLQAVVASTPRIDHDPVTGTNLGLLVEESRTNLFTTSAGAGNNNASYDVAVTVNAAPFLDGSSSMALIQSTKAGVGNDCFVGATFSIPNDSVTRTYSCYLKQGASPTTSLNLYYSGGTYIQALATLNWSTLALTVTGGTGGVIPCGLGLCRVWVVLTNNGSGNTTAVARVYVRDQSSNNTTSDTVYIGGHQLETGPFPTSYIPTTSAQATRAADNLVVPLTSDWFNNAEGTLFLDVMAGPSISGRYPGYVAIDDGTGSNGLQVVGSGGGNPYFQIANAAAANPYVTAGFASSPPQGTALRFAIAYTAAGAVASMNGGAPIPISQTLPGGLNTLRIGQTFGGGNYLNTQIRRLAYVPRATSAALLQRMSA